MSLPRTQPSLKRKSDEVEGQTEHAIRGLKKRNQLENATKELKNFQSLLFHNEYFHQQADGPMIRELEAHVIGVQGKIEALKKAIEEEPEEESEEESEKELGIN